MPMAPPSDNAFAAQDNQSAILFAVFLDNNPSGDFNALGVQETAVVRKQRLHNHTNIISFTEAAYASRA
jgi:hypothetical protein